jgi:hypothetical protein
MNVIPAMPHSVELSVLDGLRVYDGHANMMWVHMHMMDSSFVAQHAALVARTRHETLLQRIRDRILAARLWTQARE